MSIRRGAVGPPVQQVQTRLRELGQSVAVDGRFGRSTDQAVRAFQRSHHLRADGIVGPRTAAALGLHDDAFEAAPRGTRGGRGADGGHRPQRPSSQAAQSPRDPARPQGSQPAQSAQQPGSPAPVQPPAQPPRIVDPRSLPPDMNAYERLGAMMDNQSERIEWYRNQGQPVPPEELARARAILRTTDPVPRVLISEDGRDSVGRFEGSSARLHRLVDGQQ